MPTPRAPGGVDRRTFMGLCTALGLGGSGLSAALWTTSRTSRSHVGLQAQQAPGKITKEMLAAAETVIGLEFTDAERDLMLAGLNSALEGYAALRKVTLPNSVYPALRFDPMAFQPESAAAPTAKRGRRAAEIKPVKVVRPKTPEELAFLTVFELGVLIQTGQVTSEELTELALDRLKRFDKELLCVVNLTEERALKQARSADVETKGGQSRGPLHGIPWGAKDLLAVPGYPTTWGSPLYKDQVLPETATVVERLDMAGAVLVAKLTLGEFAQGDVWFGGTTKNPWKTDQGSSGSSAGPASATASGCLPFAIGSETLGSIVSPATRCGVTGLRPTFGRVSRAGAMALSWSMDKLGPLCRSAVDCGLVFGAIHGPDGKDPTVVARSFDWTAGRGLAGLRIGYLKVAFDAEHQTKAFDDQALEVLKGLGVQPLPIELPGDLPVGPLRIILSAEAAAAFDEITRSNRDDQMVQQTRNAWPNSFRTSRFIPAVEYIQANRIRTLLMQKMAELMRTVDVFVTPSFGGNVLLTTNLTGHPALVLPNGFNPDGTPVSLSFIGKLFGEAELLAVAEAYQSATDFHRRHPQKFS
jgi:Asp-tRNA(Asn)/Glu-tRNA(Gln) amidotransferase A subunit family amidase